MSVSCQYDLMKYPFFLTDFNGTITVEGELQLTDSIQPLEKIIWGSFDVEAPLLGVYDDLLVISGKVYPHLIYLTKPDKERIEPETEEERNEDFQIDRREYGTHWLNESGIDFEERITIPGLRPEMMIDVDLSPLNASFEEAGPGQIRFRGQLEAVAHAVQNQEFQVVGDVVAQSPSKVNISKEPIKLEEMVAIKKETIPIQTPLVLSNLKPGVARILTYQIRPVDVNCEIRDKIFMKGFLEVAMVYVGSDDDGRPTEIFAHEWSRAAGTAIPFETVMGVETSGSELTVIPRIALRNSKLEMKTPRELRYRAEVECEAKISRLVQREIVTDAESGSEQVIDVLKNLWNFEEYIGEKTGVINLDTTIALPNGENPERLLMWDGSPREVSLEAAEDKVLVDGSLDLRLIYTSDSAVGSGIQVAGWERYSKTSLPLAGIIDFPGIQAGALLRLQVQVDSLNLEITGDRTIKVTGAVMFRTMARVPKAVMALRDCAAVEPVDPSTRPSMLFYLVQPGDSLWKIARRYQTTMDALARVNQIINPDRIYSGQKLIIPKQAG